MTEIKNEDRLALPKQILEMGPSYFKYLMMEPTRRKTSYMMAGFITSIRFTLIGLAMRLFSEADSLLVVIDVIASASAFFQGFKSTIPIVFYKDELLWLSTQSSKFWPTDEDTKSVELFYKKAKKVLIFYKRLVAITWAAYIPVSLLIYKMPFAVWVPPITGGFYLIYLLQLIMFTFDATLVCGSDSFFVGACLDIHAQFEILQNRLSNLGVNKKRRIIDINQDIINCVQHQNFLLEYTNVLIYMYSIGLLFQFFITTYSICIEMFIFTQRDTVGMIIGLIYCFMLTFQLALYCFPADYVIDISQACAEAIYSCPWYDNSAELKHLVVNCVQRSQKRIIFTAGGFIDIDKTAFTKIFKGILSLNTLMKNMFE